MRGDKQVIVLSAPRSGSSCVAGIIQRLGINMGDKVQKADSMNPKGYYEDLAFQKIFRAYASEFEVSDFNPELDEELKMMLTKRRGVWGVKNPRLAFCYHWVAPHFKNKKVVVVMRDRKKIIESFLKYNMEDKERKIKNWLDARDYQISKLGDYHTIWYEHILHDSKAEVRALADFLGVEVTKEAVDFVDRELNTVG